MKKYERHKINDQWEVEVADHAMFVSYRGVDLFSLWLPYDDPDGQPFVTFAARSQYMDWAIHPGDGELPTTEWAIPGEVEYQLSDHVLDIERAIEALHTTRQLIETERVLKDVMDQPHASREDLKTAMFDYLDVRGEA